MYLKNANLGVAVGLAIYAIGSLLTKGNPNGLEALVITVMSLGLAIVLYEYLTQRDRKLGRPPPPSPFRR